MIRDIQALELIRAEWQVIEENLFEARASWIETEVAPSIIDFTRGLAEMTVNLCLVFAMSILEHTLLQFRDEGLFSCRGSGLNNLMAASRHSGLSWINYAEMDRVRQLRNKIAHERGRYSEDECLRMILSIKAELAHWSIIALESKRSEMSAREQHG